MSAAAIARCNAEISALEARPDDVPERAYGITMGVEDWRMEIRVILGATIHVGRGLRCQP